MHQDATKICKLFDFFMEKNTFSEGKHRYHDFIFLLLRIQEEGHESNDIDQVQIHG